jgi:hypothetical protein
MYVILNDMMTLEEAITHCQEKSCGNSECALEHKQLAEWLRELQNRRKQDVQTAIDLQEEPASKDKFTFTSLPRLLDRIKPTDRAKWYSSRLADALEKEGYITDAKIVRESIKLMNGEKVPMATMDEEPVRED